VNVQHRFSKAAQWSVFHVHPHPRSAEMLGGSKDSVEYKTLLASVRKCGILEPLVIRRDGTILSGHLRFAAALELGMPRVPVFVVEDFPSTREELEFMLRCNTDRRQMTSSQVVQAYKRLREMGASTKGRTRRIEALVDAPRDGAKPFIEPDLGFDLPEEETAADLAAFKRDCAELEALAERFDEILTRRPITDVRDDAQYRRYTRCILLMTCRGSDELKGRERAPAPRRRTRLALVKGGKA
jgi:hypothetical protein